MKGDIKGTKGTFFNKDKNVMANKVTNNKKNVETLTHDDAGRKHIPTAEYQSVMRKEEEQPSIFILLWMHAFGCINARDKL